ncbi:hypothetical protein DTO166G4_8919 [Paecilomyces variotii]|nr:hypothetical protein DTO166G4_8919 [Paecilomyces variotii]KAJ9220890.1 hypothetical protein DTO169C6_6703 [Paecilomyces variotii]KAJ9238046.1 hypothetical protein DTO166G5_3283 [Paecilomyces variotii]KAJ9246257.1 hypothetical protein DTO207G8_9138 [Paecilomyces variotii]KAJ9347482.1 hypothetical protein DTO027B9_9175 [Paecilomyces variotii]
MLRFAGVTGESDWLSSTQNTAKFREFWQQYKRNENFSRETLAAFRDVTKQLRQEVLGRADVVVCTLSRAGEDAMQTEFYPDVIAVDEAAKASESDLWNVLAYDSRVNLLVGDHRQLRPLVISQDDDKNGFSAQLGMSLSERLQDNGLPMITFDVQHRMHAQIGDLVSGLVRKNFAAHATDKSNGIIVISDEDGQSLKTNAWIPIVSLNKAELVKGSIRGGDRHQLPPLVASSFGTMSFNEFSGQLGRSLFDRLLQSGFPVRTLSVQHKMHLRLAFFPNKVNIPISGDFQLIAIDVFDSETEIEPRTKSRYNLRDFIVVMDLLIHIFHKGALGADSDLTIIIPYAERRSKYVRALIELAAEECIRWSDMIKVAQLAPCREEFNACSFFYIYIANSPQRPGLEQIQRIGASVTMEIIGSPVAPKVVFEICVRDRRNPREACGIL